MSALAKPFVHTVSALEAVDPINVENIGAFLKIDVPANGANANRPFYALEFTMKGVGSGVPTKITWRYATDTARDSDYTTLLALVSNAI